MKRDKEVIVNRTFRIIESAIKLAKTHMGQCRMEEVQVHLDGYAEPGYSDPESGVICTGNWNDVSSWNPEKRESDTVDNTPERVAKILDKLGVELEWSDEWETCSQCNKLVRSQPDSYSWTRQYWDTEDGEIVCVECVQEHPEDYLESLEGSTSKCITIDGIDPTEHGYKLLEEGFQNGLYGGQSADPKKIGKSLQKQGVERFIFKMDSVGQFDCEFSVYVHEDDYEKLDKDDYEESEKAGPDPAQQMQEYLRDASAKMGQLPNAPGVKFSQPDPKDPTKAVVRTISPQDFIDGKAFKK